MKWQHVVKTDQNDQDSFAKEPHIKKGGALFKIVLKFKEPTDIARIVAK